MSPGTASQDVEHLKRLSFVLLQTSDGRTLQASFNGTFWELLPRRLGQEDAVNAASCCVEIHKVAAPASQHYIAFKVPVAALYVQFNVCTRKMVAVAKHCGVREQLVVLKCTRNKHAFAISLRPRLWKEGSLDFQVSASAHKPQDWAPPSTNGCLARERPGTAPASLLDVALRLATGFASRARGFACPLSTAFQAWKRYPGLLLQQERDAQQWHLERLLRYSFQHLAAAVKQARRQREAEQERATAQTALQLQCFRSWLQALVQARQTHRMYACVVKRRRQLLLGRSICGWRRMCCAAYFSRRVAACSGRLRRAVLAGAVFRAWRTQAVAVAAGCRAAACMHERQKRLLSKQTLLRWRTLTIWACGARTAWFRLLSRIHQNRQRGMLLETMSGWSGATSAAIQCRQRVTSFAEARHMRMLRAVWEAWRYTAEEHVVAQQQHVDASNAWLLRVLSRAFGAWQHVTLIAKRRLRQAAACADRHRSRATAAAFYMWVHEACAAGHRRRLCQGIAARCTFRAVQAAFHAWNIAASRQGQLRRGVLHMAIRIQARRMGTVVRAWAAMAGAGQRATQMAAVTGRLRLQGRYWSTWKECARQEKAEAQRQSRAQQHFKSRRQAVALRLWLQTIQALRAMRSFGRCCERRAAMAVAAKALARWRRARTGRTQQAAILARARRQRHARMVHAAFQAWAHECAWKRRARPALLRVLRRVAQSRQSALLLAWQAAAVCMRAARVQSERLGRERRASQLGALFRAWSTRSMRSRSLRTALRPVAARLQTSVKEHLAYVTLQEWLMHVRRDRAVAAHTVFALKRHNYRLKHQAFHAWLRWSSARRRQADAVQRLGRRRLLRRFHSAFNAWRHAAARQWAARRPFHTRIAKVLRPAPPTSAGILAAALAEWRTLSTGVRRTAAVAAWAAGVAMRRRMAAAFCRWVRRAGELQHQHAMLRTARVATAGAVLRRALDAWRSAASSSRVGHVLEYQATCFWIKRALTAMWIDWRQRARKERVQRQELARAGRIHSVRALGRAWRGWRLVVTVRASVPLRLLLAQQRRLQQALQAACRGERIEEAGLANGVRMAGAWTRARAWQAWRAVVAFRHSMDGRAGRMQQRLCRRTMARCLQAWQGTAAHECGCRDLVLGRVAQAFSQGIRAWAVQEWLQAASAKRFGRCAALAASRHAQAARLRLVVSRWRQYCRFCRRLRSLTLRCRARAAAACLAGSWWRWRLATTAAHGGARHCRAPLTRRCAEQESEPANARESNESTQHEAKRAESALPALHSVRHDCEPRNTVFPWEEQRSHRMRMHDCFCEWRAFAAELLTIRAAARTRRHRSRERSSPGRAPGGALQGARGALLDCEAVRPAAAGRRNVYVGLAQLCKGNEAAPRGCGEGSASPVRRRHARL
eukprot:jgi/Ulvmu1/1472/UM011_0202.1